MIELTHKQVVVDGTPRIVMAGEVHYFRVAREEWGQRLDLCVEAGLTAVASYIPWVFHELPDGTIDVEGRTRPERDVAAFIDLCAERDLMFIARPGPFVMAELKNEGIPFRVYREHPEVVPVGWDGAVGALADRRLPRAGLPRGDEALVRGRAAPHRRAAPAQRRQRRHGPARQRGGDARLGHQRARPHRPPPGPPRALGGGEVRRQRAVPGGPGRRGVGRRRALALGGVGRSAAPRPRRVHARPLRRLRPRPACHGRRAGRARRPVRRQHPRHRGWQRHALPHRHQPARQDLRGDPRAWCPAATTTWARRR